MRRTDLEGVVNRRIGIYNVVSIKFLVPGHCFTLMETINLLSFEFDRLCQLITSFSHSSGTLLFMAVLMAIAEILYICIVLIITGLIQY